MKRVEKSLALFEREAEVLEQMWGAQLGVVPVIGTVTHQHVFGMTFRIMWPMLAGRPFHSEFHVMWEPLMAQLNGPSMLVSSPAQLTRLGGLAPVASANRPRLIITAGAPLPSDAARETAAIFGCVPTEIFGSTEAGVIAWRRGAEDPVLWQPLPSVEVAARDGRDSDAALAACVRSRWCEQADRVSLRWRRAFPSRGTCGPRCQDRRQTRQPAESSSAKSPRCVGSPRPRSSPSAENAPSSARW